jgi:hypothetical protein
MAAAPLTSVAQLLGHLSERITEKHYSASIKGRQEKLEADVRSTWPEDFKILPLQLRYNHRNIAAKLLKNKHLEWWRRGESNYYALLKTRKLLIFRNAQNARNGKFASNWNVPGTRFFAERWDLRELAIGSIWLQRLSGLGKACIFKF